MAPVVGNPSPRLKVHYLGPFGPHTLLFHGQLATTQVDLTSAAQQVCIQLSSICWDGTSFDNAEFSAAGSNLFFPAPWVPIIADTAFSPGAGDGPAKFVQLGGRGIDGVRVKWYFFETAVAIPSDYRLSAGENSSIDDIYAAIDDNAAILGTKSGFAFTPYTYANVNLNDKKVKESR